VVYGCGVEILPQYGHGYSPARNVENTFRKYLLPIGERITYAWTIKRPTATLIADTRARTILGLTMRSAEEPLLRKKFTIPHLTGT